MEEIMEKTKRRKHIHVQSQLFEKSFINFCSPESYTGKLALSPLPRSHKFLFCPLLSLEKKNHKIIIPPFFIIHY